MKRMFKALGMLCVFVMICLIQVNHGANVKAEVTTCEDQLEIRLNEDVLTLLINTEIPDYKEVAEVYLCNVPVLGAEIRVIDNFIDTTQVGEYQISLMAMTDDGYHGARVFDVFVKEDTTAPIFEQYYEKYYFKTPGDNEELDFLTGIVVSDNLDPNPVLSYDYDPVEGKVTITATDSSGNLESIEAEVIVMDNLSLFPQEEDSITFEVYDDITFETFHYGNLYDDEISYEIKTNNVNNQLVGQYTFEMSATLFNLTQTKEVTVNIVDTTPPRIIGERIINIRQGDKFNPRIYFSAHDLYDKKLGDQIEIEGHYDVDNPGQYKLTAVVQDQSGNQAEYSFTLTVEGDNQLIVWTTVILGIVIVGSSGILYYIRKRKE